MIYLTEVSVGKAAVIGEVGKFEPAAVPDLGHAVKIWMAARPGLACRPWVAVEEDGLVRLAGWRQAMPEAGGPGEDVRATAFHVADGQRMRLRGTFAGIRRNERTESDAAEGRKDKAAAYRAWLMERLIDVMPHADVSDVAVEDHRHVAVVRKRGARRPALSFAAKTLPAVTAAMWVTVKDAAAFEGWLLRGVGSNKAFGYGAFLPALDGATP